MLRQSTNHAPDGGASQIMAAQTGLMAGPVIGLALVAQQLSVSVEQWCAGIALAGVGLCYTGVVAGRRSASAGRLHAGQAGAIAGLLAGLIAALPVTALLLLLALNGQVALYAGQAFHQLEASGILNTLHSAGWSSATLTRVGVVVQLLCYGAGLPVAGRLIGAAAARLAVRRVRA